MRPCRTFLSFLQSSRRVAYFERHPVTMLDFSTKSFLIDGSWVIWKLCQRRESKAKVMPSENSIFTFPFRLEKTWKICDARGQKLGRVKRSKGYFKVTRDFNWENPTEFVFQNHSWDFLSNTAINSKRIRNPAYKAVGDKKTIDTYGL